jgi:hypothetical protein
VPPLFNEILDQIIEEEEGHEESFVEVEETDDNLRTGFSSVQPSFINRPAHMFAQSYAGNDGGTGFYGEG